MSPDRTFGATSPQDRVARDRLLDAYQPFVEADLGRGRVIRLSQRRLEWVPARGEKSLLLKLEDLRAVSLAARPVWETLSVGALLAVGVALGPPWPIRLLLGVLIVLSLAACFAQKRYALKLHLLGGQVLELGLGVGTKRAPQTQRVRSVWESLSAELRRVGVSSSEPPVT